MWCPQDIIDSSWTGVGLQSLHSSGLGCRLLKHERPRYSQTLASCGQGFCSIPQRRRLYECNRSSCNLTSTSRLNFSKSVSPDLSPSFNQNLVPYRKRLLARKSRPSENSFVASSTCPERVAHCKLLEGFAREAVASQSTGSQQLEDRTDRSFQQSVSASWLCEAPFDGRPLIHSNRACSLVLSPYGPAERLWQA